MKKIFIIAKKELQNYFFNPAGYIFAGLLLVVVNWLYWNDVFLTGTATVGPILTTTAFLFSLFIPAMVMGAIADEKRSGTYEILRTLPMTESQIILGKFVALKAYILIIMALTVPSVVGISLLTSVDWGTAAAGYFGLIMLGLAYGAITIFMSSVTLQPIVSFLVTSVILILNNMMSQEILLSRLPSTMKTLFENLSLNYHLARFNNGVVGLSDTVFMISVILLFLVLSINVLEKSEK